MPVLITLLPGAIAELYVQATLSKSLTLADRYGLLAAVLSEELLSDDERAAIDRLLRAAQRHQIKPTNELSVVLR